MISGRRPSLWEVSREVSQDFLAVGHAYFRQACSTGTRQVEQRNVASVPVKSVTSACWPTVVRAACSVTPWSRFLPLRLDVIQAITHNGAIVLGHWQLELPGLCRCDFRMLACWPAHLHAGSCRSVLDRGDLSFSPAVQVVQRGPPGRLQRA